jgi:hypothetical protein
VYYVTFCTTPEDVYTWLVKAKSALAAIRRTIRGKRVLLSCTLAPPANVWGV